MRKMHIKHLLSKNIRHSLQKQLTVRFNFCTSFHYKLRSAAQAENSRNVCAVSTGIRTFHTEHIVHIPELFLLLPPNSQNVLGNIWRWRLFFRCLRMLDSAPRLLFRSLRFKESDLQRKYSSSKVATEPLTTNIEKAPIHICSLNLLILSVMRLTSSSFVFYFPTFSSHHFSKLSITCFHTCRIDALLTTFCLSLNPKI